ncbi:MAG: sensor histidine kinase [Candidatus Methanofastidiosia archaeon]
MNKMHLGEISINEASSIVEARNKVRMLAEDVGFGTIGATKLATATSELSRQMYSNGNTASVAIGFDERERGFGLGIIFQGHTKDLDIKWAEAFFDDIFISNADGNMINVNAFKYPPVQFTPTEEFISLERERLIRLSRAEMVSELKRKNDELLALFDDLKNEKAKIDIMLEELKSVDKIKSDLVSTVSHELRTPLTSIKGYIDIILDEDAGEINETQRDFLEIVKRNTDRLASLINEFLDVQKMESKRLTMNLVHMPLSEIVEETAKATELLIKEKGLAFHKDIKPNISAWVDGDRISQVLWNLLSNSVKYTESGSICLTLDIEGDNAVISVEDTGVGMSESDQKKLFSKFFRADNKVVRDAGGTGLGLAIVKEIVAAHNGTIDVRSEFGKGSKFTVRLPLGRPNI